MPLTIIGQLKKVKTTVAAPRASMRWEHSVDKTERHLKINGKTLYSLVYGGRLVGKKNNRCARRHFKYSFFDFLKIPKDAQRNAGLAEKFCENDYRLNASKFK